MPGASSGASHHFVSASFEIHLDISFNPKAPSSVLLHIIVPRRALALEFSVSSVLTDTGQILTCNQLRALWRAQVMACVLACPCACLPACLRT